MRNYPTRIDPLLSDLVSGTELSPYLVNQNLGFRAEGHSYMDMAHQKGFSTLELIRMRVQNPEQFEAADEIAQEKAQRDLVPFYHAIKAQLELADLEIAKRDLAKLSHTQLIKYRAKLFDQLKAAHWTEVEPDKDVKCDFNLNDLEYLFQKGKRLNQGHHIPYLRDKIEPWIESPRYAELVAQAKVKEEKATAAAPAKPATDEEIKPAAASSNIITQPKALLTDAHQTTQATVQEAAKQPQPKQIRTETNRITEAQADQTHNQNLQVRMPSEDCSKERHPCAPGRQVPAPEKETKLGAEIASSPYYPKHRGIDRMACAREAAHRIAAVHPWL